MSRSKEKFYVAAVENDNYGNIVAVEDSIRGLEKTLNLAPRTLSYYVDSDRIFKKLNVRIVRTYACA